MYKGQLIVLEDRQGYFYPFKGIVVDSGIKMLDPMKSKDEERIAVHAGYIIYEGAAPDQLKQVIELGGWIYKPLMEENE